MDETPFTAWTLFADLAAMCILLMAGQVLRAKTSFVRNWRIPACVVGGFLGLLLGPNGLNCLGMSRDVASYPEILVVLIFAAVPFGVKLADRRTAGREVGELSCHVTFGALAQYGWGMLLSLFILDSIWKLHPGFGFVLGIGFWGGPGTTAAAASAFAAYQWNDVLSLGLTAWMVGVLTAILAGTVVINWRARKSKAVDIHTTEESADQIFPTGLIPRSLRRPLGMETVSSTSMESLSLHVSLVMIPSLIGWYGHKLVKAMTGLSVPAFGLALLAGFLLVWGLRITRTEEYADRATISRISGSLVDFLIVSGMAAIQVPRVIQYAAPLCLLLLFGVILSLFQALVLGPRMFREHWFEKSMLIFGMNTGTLAQGILLLRMIDPRMSSGILGTYGIVDLLIKPLTIGIVVVGPLLIGTGYAVPFAAVCSVLAFVPLVVARSAGLWRNRSGIAGKE